MHGFKQFDELLSTVLKESASDLHIAVGRHPTLRIDGVLVPLLKQEVITPDSARDFAFSLLSEEQRGRFLEEKEMDFCFNFKDNATFRVHVFHQRVFVGVSLRVIPTKIRTFE